MTLTVLKVQILNFEKLLKKRFFLQMFKFKVYIVYDRNVLLLILYKQVML